MNLEMSTNAVLQGLTPREVKNRRDAGQGNNISLQTSRSYGQILKDNLFTFINAVFFTISLVMFILGGFSDGILVIIVIFGGVLVSICQEIWAKYKLDQIALLTRPHVSVIREGKEVNIDQNDIVIGDILLVKPGDQIVVDGVIVGDGKIDVDESLLTGESDLIAKIEGDRVFSGSYCVSGMACFQADKVGKETLAYGIMSGARAFRQVYTPLQKEINLVIRVFFLIACFLSLLVIISSISRSYPLAEVVQRIAVIAGLVPAGLLMAITLAYGTGAIRMLGQNVLIQQANAVESLSNVNILCLDKTGTLTTNEISLQEIYAIDMPESVLQTKLGDYAATTKAGNKTNDAIAIAFPGKARSILTEIPFASVRKWSAIAFNDDPDPGIYVLGAPEILGQSLKLTEEMKNYIKTGADRGLRVVLFAYSPDIDAIDPDAKQPVLPPNLKPIGIIRFTDRLRPGAKETLDRFAQAGIQVKIISGDNPDTVTALAKQLGLSDDIKSVSGPQLAAMDSAQFAQTAATATIFGRITPEQKAMLVNVLRQQGNYVAMMGDGVNDVLSLKQANLAISVESGSKATRGVADIVLLQDSFGSLPFTFLEGQRIRNGILDTLKLFMVRVFSMTLLIFSLAIVTDSFPFTNKHSALISLIAVGLPTIFIPLWAKPGVYRKGSLVASMLHFTLPTTLTLTIVALLVYLIYLVRAVLDLPPSLELSQVDYDVPRSALVTILILCQLLLLPFLKPPSNAWIGGEPLSGDRRYTVISILLITVYFIIVSVPGFRNFFDITPLGIVDYIFLTLVAFEWCLLLRFFWRTRFLDKFLGVKLI